MLLDIARKRCPLIDTTRSKGRVAVKPGQACELLQHFTQEKPQPDTFSFAVFAHHVHAIVPVAGADQWQAVRAGRESAFNGANAVLIQARRLLGSTGQIVIRVVVGIDQSAVEKVCGFVQHTGVAGTQHIAAGCQWQPQIIVRAMRTHTATRRRMPPMLHIALTELASRTQQQVLAHELRLGVNECHHVLQLIAETERTARLVIATARPQTAGQRLIQEPAIGQHVERRVGRVDLYGAKRVLPVLPHFFQRLLCGYPAAAALQQLSGVVVIAPGTESENSFTFFPFHQLECDLNRCAGIECCANFVGQMRARHGGGGTKRAVATHKFGAVPAESPGRIVDIKKRNAIRKFTVVGIAGIERAA